MDASAFPAPPSSVGALLCSSINVLHRSTNAVPVSFGGMTREDDPEHQLRRQELRSRLEPYIHSIPRMRVNFIGMLLEKQRKSIGKPGGEPGRQAGQDHYTGDVLEHP
jgi:hypothetical protein